MEKRRILQDELKQVVVQNVFKLLITAPMDACLQGLETKSMSSNESMFRMTIRSMFLNELKIAFLK